MCIYVPGPEDYVLSLQLFQSHQIKSWQGKPQFSLRRSKISSTPVLWHVRQNHVYEIHPPQWCCGKTGLLAGGSILSRNIIIPNSVTQKVILSLLIMVHTMRICKLIFTSNVFFFLTLRISLAWINKKKHDFQVHLTNCTDNSYKQENWFCLSKKRQRLINEHI